MNKNIVGHKSAQKKLTLHPYALRFYAEATAQKNPIYFDEEAAKAAGHPSLPMPPTYLNCIDALSFPKDDYEILNKLNVDISRALNGGVRCKYFKPIYAGDELTFQNEVKSLEEKKGGALTVITSEMRINNQHGDLVAIKYGTLIIR